MSDVAIQRLRNEVRLSEENENSGFGQDILLVCNLCERLTDEVEQLKREVHFYRFGEEPDAAADTQKDLEILRDDQTRGELLSSLYEWMNAGGSIDRVISAMDSRYAPADTQGQNDGE